MDLCCMIMQYPVEVWPKPENGLEWFLIDKAASCMTVNLTRFCHVLNYHQRPILILGSRIENMKFEARKFVKTGIQQIRV